MRGSGLRLSGFLELLGSGGRFWGFSGSRALGFRASGI